MNVPQTPPARRGRWRFLAVLASAVVVCFVALFLAAAAVFAVQEWMRPPAVDYDHLKPAVGEPAPDFVLKGLDGEDYRLSDHLGKAPAVLEFGSATCPYCVTAAEGMDELARKYKGKAEFLFIYCKEAHPDQPGGRTLDGKEELPALPQTHGGEERARRAESYCSLKQPAAHVLVDVDGPGSVQDLYGGGQNQLVMIDERGRVALKQTTANPHQLDEFLKGRLAGP
jgi:thiol-disulfide isomerase/thioredoxin